ncbi:MAG: helix-turn-helix domain-containing protein [Bacillota bacterium]
MDFMSVRDAALLWNISERRVQQFCEEGRIKDIQRFGRSWMIPKSAEKPADPRKARHKNESKIGK